MVIYFLIVIFLMGNLSIFGIDAGSQIVCILELCGGRGLEGLLIHYSLKLESVQMPMSNRTEIYGIFLQRNTTQQ